MSIAKPQTSSLVEVLNQGFAAINRRLWVLIIPVLLNVYLWYGAQVSLRPLADGFYAFMVRNAPPIEGTTPEEVYASLQTFGQYDFTQRMEVLALVPRLTVYTVASSDGFPIPEQLLPPLNSQRMVLEVGNASVAALLFLSVNIISIPMTSAFLAMIAGAVLRTRRTPQAALLRFGQVLAAMLGYSGIFFAALLVVGLPLLVIGSLLLMLLPPLGALLLLLLFVGGFWLSVFVGFAPEGIAMGSSDPIRAIRLSLLVVRRHFWATVLLLFIIFLITVGMGVVWGQLVGSTIGLIIAVLGSAYIGCGLAAARMIFLQERVR